MLSANITFLRIPHIAVVLLLAGDVELNPGLQPTGLVNLANIRMVQLASLSSGLAVMAVLGATKASISKDSSCCLPLLHMKRVLCEELQTTNFPCTLCQL